MKEKLLNIAKFFAFLIVGLLLLGLVYKDQISYTLSDSSFEQMSISDVPPGISLLLEDLRNKSFYSESGIREAIAEKLTADQRSAWLPQVMEFVENRIQEMIKSLKGADYIWIWLSLLLGLTSHFIRAVRWKMLLKSLGFIPRTINAFLAILVNYIANLAIPRLGEVSRCGVVKQYEKIPFTKSFGTVIAERAIDMVILFLLSIIVLITQFSKVREFIETNPDVRDKFDHLFSNTLVPIIVLITLVSLLIAFIVLRHKVRHFVIYRKSKEFILSLWDGIMTVWKLEKKLIFIGYSLIIWALYFLMTYFCFFSFDFTSDLTPIAGLTVFVLSSYGMVAPVQGGIGAWHFMVTRTLFVYGIVIIPDGNAFALVVHGAQTLMLVAVGLIAIIALPLVNRRSKTHSFSM